MTKKPYREVKPVKQPSLLANLKQPDDNPPSPAGKRKTKKDISLYAKTFCQFAVAVGMPTKFRAYIESLLGLADGKSEFAAANVEIARLLRDSRKIKANSALRHVTRYGTEFFSWQDSMRIELVRRRVGRKDTQTGSLRIHIMLF